MIMEHWNIISRQYNSQLWCEAVSQNSKVIVMNLLVLGLCAEYGAGNHTLCAGHGVLLLVHLVRPHLAQSFTEVLPLLLPRRMILPEAVSVVDVLDSFPQLLQTHHSYQSADGGNIGMIHS